MTINLDADQRPEVAGGPGPDPAPWRSVSPGELLEKYAGVLVLAALFLVFSVLRPDTFLVYGNLVGILANGAITGILALGLLLPLSAGLFDISISGSFTVAVIGVMVLFKATNGSIPIVLAVGLVLLGAALVGSINAFGILKLKIDPFIMTIGTGSLLTGLSQILSGGSTVVEGIPETFVRIGRTSIASVPISVYIFGVLAVLLWYVLRYTPFGRALYATGASREATRLAGVNTNRIIWIAMMCSAVGAAIGGIVLAARIGSGPPGLGDSYLLGAYASAFLGSTMITPGRFNVVGLVVATLILGVGVNGFQLLGAPFWIVPIFQGSVLLVAVALGNLRKNLSDSR